MRLIKRIIKTITVIASLAVAAAIIVFAKNASVLRIYGSSMYPVQQEGDIILTVKAAEYNPGDIIAFYHGDKILVKRIIGISGDWIDIRDDGTVFVNERQLREPYLKESAFGSADIVLPYQTPEGMLFVMNDQRLEATDSRSSAVGCVKSDDVIGKCMFCLWPVGRFGVIR